MRPELSKAHLGEEDRIWNMKKSTITTPLGVFGTEQPSQSWGYP